MRSRIPIPHAQVGEVAFVLRGAGLIVRGVVLELELTNTVVRASANDDEVYAQMSVAVADVSEMNAGDDLRMAVEDARGASAWSCYIHVGEGDLIEIVEGASSTIYQVDYVNLDQAAQQIDATMLRDASRRTLHGGQQQSTLFVWLTRLSGDQRHGQAGTGQRPRAT